MIDPLLPEAIQAIRSYGISAAFLFQMLFSQWNVMNQLFDTAPLNLSRAFLCIAIGFPMIGLASLLRRFAPLK